MILAATLSSVLLLLLLLFLLLLHVRDAESVHGGVMTCTAIFVGK